MKKSLQLFVFLLFPSFLFSQNYFEPLGGPVGVSVKSSFKDANGVLYTKTDGSVKHQKSYDDGETWLPLQINDSIQIEKLYADEMPNLYAIADGGKLYKIAANGNFWTLIYSPSLMSSFNTLSISPNGELFFRDSKDLYFSSDKGDSWALISESSKLTGEIQFHPNGDLYSLVYIDGVSLGRSTDGGFTWEKIFVPDNNGIPNAKSVHISKGGVIYLQDVISGIFPEDRFSLSYDNGFNFEELFTLFESFSYLTTNSSEDIFYSDRDSIYMSKDKGHTWINISSGLPTSPKINHIYIDNDQYIYLSLKDNVLYKSIVPSTQITAIDDPMGEPFFSIDISPNPASSFINFQLRTANSVNHAIFRILDVHGKLIKEIKSQKPKELQTVPVHDWAAGIYFLQYVKDGLVRHSEKFVVN